MASDTELFKDKIEISLDGRQVFYLFFGGAVIASLVFVLGVMVGKRVESRSHFERSAATSATLDPLAALDQLSSASGGQAMSYASTLTGGAIAPQAVDRTIAGIEKARAAPGPVAKPVAAAAPARSDDEDGHDARARAAEKERAHAVERAATEKAATDKAAAEKASEKARTADKLGADKARAADKAKSADKVAAAASVGEGATKPADSKERFTLQLSSFQDRGEAEVFLARMKTAGYGGAVMTEANVEGKGTYFRVRVGRYTSYEAAVEAKNKFEADQQIIAYVSRI